MKLSAVDLFCGAGGLTLGLRQAGIDVRAGFDLDGAARFPYEFNNPGAQFFCKDVSETTPEAIRRLLGSDISILAGCAPCQPFSKLTNGRPQHKAWGLLDSFSGLIKSVRPHYVSMENVPELARRGRSVFQRFLTALDSVGYFVDWQIVNASHFGVPQNRRRLVLLASRLAPIQLPKERTSAPKTVRDSIGDLRPVASGAADPLDPLHVASALSDINLRRVRATPHDGGSKSAWPSSLTLACHQKETGARYSSIYGRLWWDRPAPTITTLCNSLGSGRFGHPEQDRAITLREAAILQSFPREYAFSPPGEPLRTKAVARMIGNAVPPALAAQLGDAIVAHAQAHSARLASDCRVGAGSRKEPKRSQRAAKIATH